MIKKLSTHRLITALYTIALAFVIGGCLWACAELGGVTGNPLILHFNDLTGITQVGGLATIVFMGVFGALVVLMNFAIALEFADRPGVAANSSVHGQFFARFLAVITLAFAVLLFIAFAAIINANV
jgi:hypothetical protein